MKTQLLLTTSLVAVSLLAIEPASARSGMSSPNFGGGAPAVHSFAPPAPMMHAAPPPAPMMHVAPPPAPSHISVGDGNGGFKPYLPPARSPELGSTTYGGNTTIVTRTGNISVTDGYGKTVTTPRPMLPPGISVDDGKGGWKPYVPPAKSPELGSTTYGGKTTVVYKNGDVGVTGGNGKTTVTPKAKLPPGISVDDGKGGWKPYMPPAKSNELGSTTYGGKTTVVYKNGNVGVTDANGKTTVTPKAKPAPGSIWVDDGKGGWKRYVPPAKTNILGSTTYNGETRVVTQNPDGSHTVTVTPAK
jgi:hypothetical protein